METKDYYVVRINFLLIMLQILNVDLFTAFVELKFSSKEYVFLIVLK